MVSLASGVTLHEESEPGSSHVFSVTVSKMLRPPDFFDVNIPPETVAAHRGNIFFSESDCRIPTDTQLNRCLFGNTL